MNSSADSDEQRPQPVSAPFMDEVTIQEKLDELVQTVLDVRAAHQIQAGVIAALIATIDQVVPGAIARIEALE